MSFLSRIRRWFEDGYYRRGELSRMRRLIFSPVRLYVHVAGETMSAGYLQRAGALSFATLLTLVPLLTLSFSLYSAFGGADRDKVQAAAKHLLSNYFLGPGTAPADRIPAPPAEAPRVRMDIFWLPLPVAGAGDAHGNGGAPPSAVLLPLPMTHTEKEHEAAASKDQISQWSERIASAIVGLATNASTAKITSVGALFFILASVLLFSAIEGGFNAIWHVRGSRRFLMKFSVFCTILFLTPLLIGMSLYAGTALVPVGDYLRGIGFGAGLAHLLSVLAPSFLVTWLAFFLAYMIVPHARVAWRNALFGAFIATILWEVAKYGFGAYVGHMVGYRRVYGSLAAIPIFMVWIFITWIITLFGAGVTYTSQHLGAIENRHRRDRDGGLVSTPLALSLVLEVARRFADNFGPVSSAELAAEAGATEDEIRNTLHPLVHARILALSVAGGFKYQPARPLENIRLTEVLDAVKEKDSSMLVLPNYRELVSQLLGKTRAAEQRELEGVTLKDILVAQSAEE